MIDKTVDKFIKAREIFKWAMENKLAALIIFVVAFFVLGYFLGGIVGFILETIIHLALVMALLIFLKKKGFFD